MTVLVIDKRNNLVKQTLKFDKMWCYEKWLHGLVQYFKAIKINMCTYETDSFLYEIKEEV